jgi:hypothetical protein
MQMAPAINTTIPNDMARARPEPLGCPICGRPLKSTANSWLASLACDRCGTFPDFAAPRYRLPHDAPALSCLFRPDRTLVRPSDEAQKTWRTRRAS